MTKAIFVVFALLTGGAAWMTVNDVWVLDGSIRKPSVRQGSVMMTRRGYGGIRGGYRGGK